MADDTWVDTKRLEIFCILPLIPSILLPHSTETPQLAESSWLRLQVRAAKLLFGLALALGVKEVHRHGLQ